jgi:hypothetical protein
MLIRIFGAHISLQMEVSANTTNLARKHVGKQQYGQEIEYIVYHVQDMLRSQNRHRVYSPFFQTRTSNGQYHMIATYYMRIMSDGDKFHQVLDFLIQKRLKKLYYPQRHQLTLPHYIYGWWIFTEQKQNNIPQHWQLNQN